VLDKPNDRLRASLLAEEFDGIDTRSEILRIVSQVSHISDEDGLRRGEVAENKTTRAHLNANHLVPIDCVVSCVSERLQNAPGMLDANRRSPRIQVTLTQIGRP
jgi:hypothetical protein